MTNEIVIVSGLPRSGTSLMMQLVKAGGMEIVTDHIRTADVDNPRGYHEFERVKNLKEDSSWLPEIRGKAIKIVSKLLYELPANESYRIIFMERDLDEVLASQEKMLARRGQPSAARSDIFAAFSMHLIGLHAWLASQGNIVLLRVAYADVLARPNPELLRINTFLGERLDVAAAARAIDSSLYRNHGNSLNPVYQGS
jgi:hypothetical protein